MASIAQRRAKTGMQVETYEVHRADQLQALVSTRRHDIVDQISAAGEMSVRQLAEVLNVAPSSLYYHVQHLCDVGLLREAGTRSNGPKPEVVYTTAGRRMKMFRALQEPRHQGVLTEIVTSLCKQAAQDFARGFSALHCLTAGRRRNVRFFRLVGRPDSATLELINSHLDAVTELMLASANGPGEPVTLMWVQAPQPRGGDS